MREQTIHWSLYIHHYLKNLSRYEYVIVRYKDLIADPQSTIENIYERFGLTMSLDYRRILEYETENQGIIRVNTSIH